MKKPSWWDKPITWGNYATLCGGVLGIYVLGIGCLCAKVAYDVHKFNKELESTKEDLNNLGI